MLVEEKLAEAADQLGTKLRQELVDVALQSKGYVTTVRGKGMLNAIVIEVRTVCSCILCFYMLCSLNAIVIEVKMVCSYMLCSYMLCTKQARIAP